MLHIYRALMDESSAGYVMSHLFTQSLTHKLLYILLIRSWSHLNVCYCVLCMMHNVYKP